MAERGCWLFFVIIAALAFVLVPSIYSSKPAPSASPSTPTLSTLLNLPTTKPKNTRQGFPGGIRLPKTIRPLRYEIRLRPYLSGDFKVEGEVKIDVMVQVPTQFVILHMADIITLNHTAKVVMTEGNKGIGIVAQRHSVSDMLYVAELEEELLKGSNYTFSISFLGTLGQSPRGFYRSFYTKENGNISWVASTQFQAIDARRAFPCFDEPEMKATFKIFLARKEGMTALSNMPLLHTTAIDGEEGWFWDEFEESVLMPVYLVAFAISDFSKREVSVGKDNSTLIRVVSRASVQSSTGLAGDITSPLLSYYEQYFGIPYMLPKLDLFSPLENSFNGMENWGLITIREASLLYTPGKSSLREREWTTYLVGHELAHMWFGNLVTFKWWNDLWLNEGFATYVGTVAMDQIEPGWGALDQFVVKKQQSVMALDALRSSHPVSVPVPDPAIMNEIFDTITYNKGASVIRMMSKFLTERVFRSGLRNYLTTLMFKNAEQDDLWHYLTEAAHEAGTLSRNLTVKTIMDTWTLQMGFPVVTVTRINNTTATVTQEYFKLDDNTLCPTTPSSSNPSTSPPPPVKSWWVPLTYTSGEKPNFNDTRVKLWMAAGEEPQTYEVTVPDSSHWVIFNILQSAYYRVNYDEANWKLLALQLRKNHHVIHAINRAQIIDDAFNLARAGRLSYEMVLDLISYLAQEREYVPWSATFSNLQYIYSMFHRDPAYGALKDYILSLIQPLYENIGTEEQPSDSLQTQQLRSDMLTWACRLGHVHCRNMSLSLYRQWMADPIGFKGISPNFMEAVGCTALEAGGEAEWSFAWKQPQMKDVLGCTQELWMLMRYLEGGFNASSGIRRQDAAITFRRVATQGTGAVLAWDYMRANWERIVDYIGTTFFALPRMVEDVTRSFNTRQQLQELQAFQKQYSSRLLTATTAVQQAVEATRINVAWMNKNRMFIVDWLAGHGYTSNLDSL
ncbi:hypothetical protein O3P69_001275 [Scylla paramamosain]|uniref:Aminopeptidase n=1 Tax=Scylla paramamosain TaxID=85552 RepID=A0AAW0UTP8_SCYPA